MHSSIRLTPLLFACALTTWIGAVAPRAAAADPRQACTYSVSPSSLSLGSGATTGSLTVTTSAGCSWTAASNISWLTITSGSNGTGNGTVSYAVTENTGATQRTGTLTIAGLTINVSQSPPPTSCTYTIAPTSQAFSSAAGTGNVAVTTSSSCFWRAISNVSWITVTGGGSLTTGNGTVTYSVSANATTEARTGTLTIGGQTFTVTQSAPGAGSCAFTISPSSISIGVNGGSGTISVSPNLPSCAWTASSTVNWITITSGASGTGNGTVAYSVAANTGTLERTGTITIGGVAVTVTQSGPSVLCTYTITPTTQAFGSIGGTGTITVAPSMSTCGWRSVSNVAWITVTSGSATGAGTATYRVASNGTASSRTGTVAVGDRTLTVTQSGAPSTAAAPFGLVDTPAQGATGVTGSIAVTGWALDDIEVTNVRILRNAVGSEAPGTQIFVGTAVIVTGARPDVAAANPTMPFNDRAGWGYLLLTNMLPNKGDGTYTLHVYADDRDGHTTLLGSRTITCTNSTAVKPFGAIDTPAQGATVSGNTYVNFGWALTPLPKTIPTDGSTINVFIDGVAIGRPTYNQFRSDISTLFPGLNNSNGPVGFLSINTFAYSDGVHTISWSVTDNQGSAEGIGSRYFTIKNLTSMAVGEPRTGEASLRIAPDQARQRGIALRRGYDESAPFEPVEADREGVHTVRAAEMARLVIDLGDGARHTGPGLSYEGYVANGQERGPLPIGSTLDRERGIFSWQPGPGFIGTYDLMFERTNASGVIEQIAVRIELQPR